MSRIEPQLAVRFPDGTEAVFAAPVWNRQVTITIDRDGLDGWVTFASGGRITALIADRTPDCSYRIGSSGEVLRFTVESNCPLPAGEDERSLVKAAIRDARGKAETARALVRSAALGRAAGTNADPEAADVEALPS